MRVLPLIIALILLLTVAAYPQAVAKTDAGAPPADNADTPADVPPPPPTEITAESVEYDMNKHVAVLKGNVKVVDHRMDLMADAMTVAFKLDEQENEELDKVHAVGNVVVLRDKQRATGGKMMYDAQQGFLELDEQPLLEQEGNRVTGAEQLVFQRDEGIFTTRGGRPSLHIRRQATDTAAFDVFATREGDAEPAPEAAPPTADAPEAPPAEIIADVISYHDRAGLATFIGNVQIIDREMNLKADKMTVHFNAEKDAERIVAEGGVEIMRDDNKATGGLAEYDVAEGMIVLTRDPVLLQGNKMKMTGGDHVTYSRKAGKFKAEGPNLRMIFTNVGSGSTPLDILDRDKKNQPPDTGKTTEDGAASPTDAAAVAQPDPTAKP